MKIVKAILTILLLIIVLTIPRLIKFLLTLTISILVIFSKTISYFIKLVEEEVTTNKNVRKTSNNQNKEMGVN